MVTSRTPKPVPLTGKPLDRKVSLLWDNKEKMSRLVRDILGIVHVDKRQ